MQNAFATMAAAVDLPLEFESFKSLGASTGDSVTKTMTLAAIYDASEGKFPAAYGNVALIDCHYLQNYLFDYAENTIKPELNIFERIAF